MKLPSVYGSRAIDDIIITSINQLVAMPVQGICQGGQPIISYNYGADKPERVKKAFFTQFCACVAYTFTFWAVIMLFPQIFASIFTANFLLLPDKEKNW